MTFEDVVIRDMTYNIRVCGGSWSSWYVGVAANPKAALFGGHRVSKSRGTWAYSNADSYALARRVAQHFLDLGCAGGPGGGDENTVYVYAYKKSSRTDP